MKLTIVATLALATLAACSDSDGLSTANEGVYAVSSWTGTTNGCDGPAAPIAPPSSRPQLYIESESVLSSDFINVAPCDDPASCQAEAESSEFMTSLIGWTFTSGSDGAGWTGTGGELVSGDGTTCSGTASVATMTFTGSAVHVENRRTDVEWAAPAGGCSFDDLHPHAAGAACTSLISVDATFASEL